MSGKLAGRGALITGGTQGFGFEVARAFVREGADVFVCGRDSAQLEVARAELTALARQSGSSVGAMAADVSSRADVGPLVAAAAASLPSFTILVNNAGIYGPKGPLADVEWEQWLQAISVNLAGSALVALTTYPHFARAGYGKVIQLSGGGATAPLPGLSAYAASKAGVVRLAETLALEWREQRIDVNSLAPGSLNTRLLDEVIEAGPERVGADFHARMMRQRETGGSSIENAAACAVWLASAASDGVTGKLLSAVWDPWLELPAHIADLDCDVYTLRRIVPADRGMAWGDPPT